MLLAFGFSTHSNGASSNRVATMGAVSCGKWVENRTMRFAISYEYWLHGYLSGIAIGTNKNFLEGTDGDSLDLWMDDYCQKNPLNSIGNGGSALAMELMKRMH
jgi:hypothetical protein